MPQKIKDSMIVLIHKKGSRTNPNNYRPINLLSHIYKVFISILYDRLNTDFVKYLPEEQAAYQENRGCTEQIFSLLQVAEKAIEFNKPLHIVFIDFCAAFDSIKWSSIWETLERTGINLNYIDIFKCLYENSRARVRTDVGMTEFFNIKKGAKQGDKISAILFCLVLATVTLNITDRHKNGFEIGKIVLTYFAYSDDKVILGENNEDLQKYLDEFVGEAEKVGLQINKSKTKSMTIKSGDSGTVFKIGDNYLDQVDSFTYLGHEISSKNCHEKAISRRICLAWAAFKKKAHLFNSKKIPTSIKLKLYRVYIQPVVLYGMESITWTKRLTQKVRVFQNDMMRSICGYKRAEHISINHLLEKTGLEAITDIIKKRTSKWETKIINSNAGVVKLCLEGDINGKRKRGRPKLRWKESHGNL